MGASGTIGNASVVDEKLTSKTEDNKTPKSARDIARKDLESVSGKNTAGFHGELITFASIATGIGNISEEQRCRKLRYERLQQWRLILFALNRQKCQYRQLRERLSKIGEGRFTKEEPVIDNTCNVCSRQIHIIDTKSFITCCECNKRICNDVKCSNLLARSGRWICQLCHAPKNSLTHTQSWIAEQMFFNRQKYVYHPMRARSEIYIPIRDYNEGSTIFESVSQVGLNPSIITANQKAKIREYVEEVESTLLGGSLDQNRVTQLSKSENYLPGIMNNHAVHQHSVGLNNNQTNENILTKFPEISQTRLRHMVESIIAEMLATPNLSNVNVSELELNTHKNGNGRPQHCHRYRTEHYFEPRAYQDFLTTTVLNKISHKEANVRRFSESTPDLCSSNIDVNFNMEDRSTSSNSSLGPTSAFSYADAERSPKVIKDLDRESTLNDYIASHMVPLPDLSNAMTESEDDDNASISSSILIEGNWEDNWLFRKKRPSITTSMTGSIGMLIPAPKDDVRAQIGDKTTDEISDLSEMESDTDDSSLKIYSSLDPRSDRILNKHLIGGQNTKGILDELIETASLVSNTSLPRSESNYFETMNKHVLEVASKTEAFNSCIASNSPQEEEIKLKSKPKNYYEDHLTPETENNSLSAPFQTTESIHVGDSCTGFSSVENVLSHDTRSICPGASVIEILAAITLGPLLAVSASEQPSIQAPFEISSLKDLSDIALTEIKSRAQELRHHSLDVIDEEEESKIMNSLNEIFSQNGVELADIKTDTTSPHINDTIRKLIDEKSLQSEGKPSLAVRHHRITYYTDEVPSESRSDTEQEAGFVMDKDSANQTPSSKQKECNHETETPYTYDTDKREYSSEEKEGIVMDKEAPELSAIEREKQISYIEPEGEFIMNNESENGISFSVQKEECGYDEGDNESNSGKKRDGVMDTEIFTMEREKQNPYNVADAESENRTPFSDNYSGNYTKATEFSKIADIFATENLEAISEFHLNRVVDTDAKAINTETSNISYIVDTDKHESKSEQTEDNIVATEAVEYSEPQREKQMPSNQPETERAADREGENRITFSGPKDECANDSETKEFSETSYISATENLEHFMELNRDRVIETTALELIVTNSKTQEASETPYTSYTDKHEYSREGNGNSGIDKGALEFSTVENEKQTSYNEPKGVFITDTKCENEVSYSKQTDQNANVKEAHKASETPVVYEAGYVMEIESANRIPSSKQKECPYKTETNRSAETAVTSDTDTKESNSETKEDIGRNKGVQKFSGTESEKHTLRTAPEGEFIMNIESENEIYFSMQKEECAYDIEDHESSSENNGDSVMDTESAEIVTMESEKQHPSNVADAEGDNRTPSNYAKKECGKNTKATESSEIAGIFATENLESISKSHLDRVMDTDAKELSAVNTEASNISYNADTDKHESNNEGKEDNTVATEAVEDSTPQSEKPNPSKQPETECITDRERVNRILFSGPKEECLNDTEAREFSVTSYISESEDPEHFKELNQDRVIETAALEVIVAKTKAHEETPYTSDIDKHEFSSEEKGNSGIDKEALKLSVTENGNQTPWSKSEVEFITDTKSETEVPYSKQTDQSAYDSEAHKISETRFAYDTESGAEYIIEIESANRIPSSKQKECHYETETQKTSETTVISDADNQESSSETKEEDKEVQEFSATESEKHTPHSVSEGEFIMNIESENEIYFSMQKDECAYDIEDHESSSEDKGDSVMDTESDEIFTMENEKQNPYNVADAEGDYRTPSNDPKKECGKTTKATKSSETAGIFATENLKTISESHLDRVMDTASKELFAVNMETSNTSYTGDTEKHESISEKKVDNIVATETVEDSAPQSEKPKPSKQPETECLTYRESENRILLSGTVKECDHDTEDREFSVTSYISESENPEHFKKLNRDRVIETAALELIVTKTKAHEVSETTFNSDTEKHEYSSEEKGNSGITKKALEFSGTENKKQTTCTEPEREFITDTKSENGIAFSIQQEECAYDDEDHESSSEDKGDMVMDTESAVTSIMESEKQKPCNVSNAESDNRTPSCDPQKECDTYTRATEPLEISDLSATENLQTIESQLDRVMNTPAIELFVINTEDSKPSYPADTDKHESNSEGKEDNIVATEAVENSAPQHEKQMPSNEAETKCVMNRESEIRVPFNGQKEKCGNDTEARKSPETSYVSATENLELSKELNLDRVIEITVPIVTNPKEQEVPETPNTLGTDKHEYSSGGNGNSGITKKALEFSATENKKQTTCAEPEGEFITDTKSENIISLSMQKEECAYDVEDHESSSEDKRKNVMDTESAEILTTESRKQNSSNVVDAEGNNRIPSNYPKKEWVKNTKATEYSETAGIFVTENLETISESHLDRVMDTAANEVFAVNTEASNTSYTADAVKHESNSEQTEDNIVATEAIEDSASQREKPKRSKQPETECVTDRENENLILFSGPKDEWVNDTEARELSVTSYISTTKNPEHFKELNLDRVIEIAVPIVTNIKAQEASEAPNNSGTDKHQSNSAGKEDNIVATEAVEDSAPQREKPKPSNQPEENENRIIVTKTKAHEVSETPYSSDTDKHEYSREGKGNSGIDKEALEFCATENQEQPSWSKSEGEFITDTKSKNEVPYNKQTDQSAYEAYAHKASETRVVYDTKPGAGCVMEIESANRIPSSKQKECPYETETNKSSETPVTSGKESQETSSETKEDIVRDKTVQEFSATESEKHTPCSAPEGEFVMNTESEKEIYFSMQREECAYDVEDHKSSSEDKGESVIDTESAEISIMDCEKKKPCNVSNAESDNRTPSSDPRKECGTYTRATESLEISDISAIENIVTIESQLDRVMNTATVELFVINIEDSKTSYTADTDKYECNSEEKEDNIVATEAGENSAPQRKKQMPSNEAETKYVMNRESENRIPFNGPIEECDNETETSKSTETSYISATENLEHSKELNLDRVIEIAVPIVTNTKSQEASEAPNTSDSDIHEYISEGKGDSGVDKEALEYSATESQKQTSCTEPEGECIMDANNDNGLSFSKQEATEREKQTEQEIMGESIEDNIMDTKVADFLETKNEGQMPGEECFINNETESRPPCNNSEEEYDNVAEVPESSHETQYACGSEEQEHISNVNKNLASRTPVEFSATVLLTTEDCVNEAEAQQSSETPYICDTVIQESNSDINEKNNVNSNEEELSATETEEQKNSTETEAGYDMETKTENLIPVREKKKDFNNYAEVQKHSETHYSKESNRNNIVCVEPLEFSATDSEARESSDPIYYSDTYKHECNCEANEDNIMATIAVVISATESKKQKSRNNPEDECAITEGENRISFIGQKEVFLNETEAQECSAIPYSSDTNKPEYLSEEKGDTEVELSALEIEKQNQCNDDTESENRIHTGKKEDWANMTKAQRSLKIPYVSDTDKKEAIYEAKRDIVMDTEAVEFSATKHEKQITSNEPEAECFIDKEIENGIPLSERKEKCSTETEVQESSKTPHTSATEKLETSSEAKRGNVMGTEAVEFSASESHKQKLHGNREETCIIVREVMSYPKIIFEIRNRKNRDDLQKEYTSDITGTTGREEQKYCSEMGDECSDDTETTRYLNTYQNSENHKQLYSVTVEGFKVPHRFENEIPKHNNDTGSSEAEHTSTVIEEIQKENPHWDREEVCVKNIYVLGWSETMQSNECEQLETPSETERTNGIGLKVQKISTIPEILEPKHICNRVSSLTYEVRPTFENKSSSESEENDSIITDTKIFCNISVLDFKQQRIVKLIEDDAMDNDEHILLETAQISVGRKYTEYQNRTSIEQTKLQDEAQNKSMGLSIQITDIPLKTSNSNRDNNCNLEEKSVLEAFESGKETKLGIRNFLCDGNVQNGETHDSCLSLVGDVYKSNNIITVVENAETIKTLKTSDTETNVGKPAKVNSLLSNIVIAITNNACKPTEIEPVKNLNAITKQLHRQPHEIDVTSSEENYSLRTIMYIATMSKTLINDKRLLASLERRRRQTEIMQKYLRSLDSFEFEFESEYFNQDLLEEQSFILSTPPPPLPKTNIAAEINSYFEKSLRELKSNFLKNNLFSDQLRSDINRARKSTQTTTESNIDAYNNDQGISHTNKCNNSFINTTNLTNGSYPNLTPCTKSNGKQGQHFIYNSNYERDNHGEEDDVIPLRKFVPGSIAEREYKKWYNAVEMPNNPYSPEALERRISGSQERFIDLPNINSSTNKNVITITETTKAEEDSENEHRSDIGYKRYSRDYYINADNTPKVSPKHQIHRNDRRKRLSSGCSDEHIADTGTKECISQVNETIAIKNPNVIHPTVYLALPVQVVEESTSFETLSNQPMQSVDTTNSDDSDTIRIYDFKNQTTVVVHNEGKPLTGTDTTAIKFRQKTVEPFQDTATNFTPIKYTCKVSCQNADVSTPTLGPTPNAFKFLQPKRRIIDPSQMLPLNEEAQVLSFGEKSVVEEEVAQVMPSVKALAQAFLLSSNKCSQAEKRWKKGIQKMPSTSIQFSNPPETYTENIVKVPEKTEDTTISSDLSSLETDPSINVDISTNKTSRSPSTERTVNNEENNNKNTTNMLRRVSMLKSNIAFFENLKFK